MGNQKYFTRRLIAALGSYLILALIAVFALDGMLRAGVLCFFALLTARTLIAARDQDAD